jgi:hypothetical protein
VDGHEPVQGVLGDFRIIKEIGRGGMGVVYEATQIPLNRRVALKVLPFASTLDARHLQRFKNEAQAAACLHHTNIVPVFAVGQERGVHFYAMQFIEGQTLAEVIGELKQTHRRDAEAAEKSGKGRSNQNETVKDQATLPTSSLRSLPLRGKDFFRTVAELGIQAAEALVPSFVGPGSYSVGTNPADALNADFNNDAKLDLAVVNRGSNSVSVLLGNGDGTFQPALNSATHAGPVTLKAADFNGDGRRRGTPWPFLSTARRSRWSRATEWSFGMSSPATPRSRFGPA